MTLNLANGLSAIVQDYAGVTHVVWVGGDSIWHAVYDPNSASWINARAIADISGQSIKSLNLIADPNLILESGSKGTLLPGLAVIYQEGKENDSNFFYTAGRYNPSGYLQWLPTPQALTADQVGDLEPRAIVNNGLIAVVGQKVDFVKAQNQAIREDTDLYYQTFQIQTNQFNQFVAPQRGQAPTAPFNPPTSKDGVVQGYSVFSSASSNGLAQANIPFTLAEAQSNGFQGWGSQWTVSQSFDTDFSDLLDYIKENSSDEDNNDDIIAFLTKPIFNKFIIGGTLQASGQTSQLSLLASASLTFKGKTKKLQLGNFSSQFEPEFSIAGSLSSQYNFTNDPSTNYPLANQTGSLSTTASLKIPLPGLKPFYLDALASGGLTIQWEVSPTSSDSGFSSPISAVLHLNGDGGIALLSSVIGIPPTGALAGIGIALFSTLTDVLEDLNPGVQLDSFLFEIPVSLGADGGIKIPLFLDIGLKVLGSLTGSIGEENNSLVGTIQAGVPITL